MTAQFEFEKRKFIRLPMAVPVRYKFLSREMSGGELDAIHEGVTQNIGAGGLLLRGKLPNPEWLSLLLTREKFFQQQRLVCERPGVVAWNHAWKFVT